MATLKYSHCFRSSLALQGTDLLLFSHLKSTFLIPQMRLFKKKTSTNSTSSAGISSSVQRISQKSYASGENALAYPGREKVDVRAPYFFSKEPAPHSTDLIKRDLFRNISQTDRLINGHEVIAFYQITGGGAYRLPPNSTYQRQPWTVGIAINPFRAVQWSTGYMREKAAHWGIYIRPQGKSGVRDTYSEYSIQDAKSKYRPPLPEYSG